MKILIVEDEQKMSEYLCKGLTEQGCAVDVASNGIDGQHLAIQHDYDVIVLDVMLPGMDGFAVLRSLRRERWLRVAKRTVHVCVRERRAANAMHRRQFGTPLYAEFHPMVVQWTS